MQMIDKQLKSQAEKYKCQITQSLKKYAEMFEELANDSPDVYKVSEQVYGYFKTFNSACKTAEASHAIVQEQEDILFLYSVFQKICLNMPQKSLQTLEVRRDILKKKSRLTQNIDLIDSTTDLSSYSEPVLLILSEGKRSMKI